MLFFLACDTPSPSSAVRASDVAADVAMLQEQIDALKAEIGVLSAATPPAAYTDEMAVAAIQNDDPWSDPDRANLQNLWSETEQGFMWLDDNRWTMDNRTDPPGEMPRQELVQMFHETPECAYGATFDSCNSTTALKMYINGPRITDNDWSAGGFASAAVRTYHTHASGLYLVSFGQGSYTSDYGSIIPPSGIHMEPHGAHQALRIDGTGNSGENVRIDTTLGATGIAIYDTDTAGLYCDALGRDCTVSYPLYIRGGRLHLEDLTVERSATDARNAGVATLHGTSLGVEHFYAWHMDPTMDVPVHCTWNSTVGTDSLVFLKPYSTSPDLREAHSYALVDVWGPGEAPAACTGVQSIKTDAAGVYGYVFDASLAASGGFSVAILGASGVLDPGAWGEIDRPAFGYEVVEKL